MNEIAATKYAKILAVAAWALLSLIAITLFYRQITRMLDDLAGSLKVKSIKVTGFGMEAELSPQEVQATVDALLREFSDPTNELAEYDVQWLDRIAVAEGRQTVIELVRLCIRSVDVHHQLRRLRDRQLIQPNG